MAATVRLDGLSELRDALRALPADMATEAGVIVREAAETTAAQIKAVYPVGPTGNLRRGVAVSNDTRGVAALAIVKSRAPHAHLWEYGTQVRRTNRSFNRGRMPSPTGDTLVSIAQRVRRGMYQRLVALVERAGFTVSGGL
jgi:hypothetical protein